MASSSLNRMSVPAGDTSTDQIGGALLMPKLQYRFRVVFQNFGIGGDTNALTQQVVDVSRPTVTFPEINVPVYNSRIYLAGKPEWTAISVNLRDDASGKVAGLIGSQLQKQFDFAEQASAASGIDYKFTMLVQMLDGGQGASVPNVLETWELYGCFVQSANYQTLNYGSNEVVTIQLSIRYDNAQQGDLNNTNYEGLLTGLGVGAGRRIRPVAGTPPSGGVATGSGT